ncbi:hypothetical protein [Paenibacillus sp.]|uniref:hypothetical protein n=1 Tax=Paenibacillus sp. TaxID=58172 RepID=UPI002D62E2D5|nr:hypothetical protein [Paenibacillus sp.]HZG55252.1 hypothetical protein [Paenibacillus sp.]
MRHSAAMLFQSKEEFADFILGHAAEEVPGARLVRDGRDPLHAEVFFEGLAGKSEINLHNAWMNYVRTQDLNQAVDALNGQLQAIRLVEKQEELFQSIRLQDILPALRGEVPVPYGDGGDSRLVFHEHVPKLATLYLIRKEGVNLLMNKSLLEKLKMTEAQLRARAVANLRKSGWVKPARQYVHPAMPDGATIHHYERVGRPFELQFFLPEMTRGHLPSSFVCAVPNRGFAAVLTVDRPIATADQAKSIAWRTGFAAHVSQCYRRDRDPVSPNLYFIKKGSCTILGNVKPWKGMPYGRPGASL